MITNKQRNFLRSTGNTLNPVIIVGKAGVTDQVVKEADLALAARELIKGRVLPHIELDVKSVATQLAERTGAEIVQTVGRNMLLYRAPQDGTPSRLDWPEED